jgi:hypothetical protein
VEADDVLDAPQQRVVVVRRAARAARLHAKPWRRTDSGFTCFSQYVGRSMIDRKYMNGGEQVSSQ